MRKAFLQSTVIQVILWKELITQEIKVSLLISDVVLKGNKILNLTKTETRTGCLTSVIARIKILLIQTIPICISIFLKETLFCLDSTYFGDKTDGKTTSQRKYTFVHIF